MHGRSPALARRSASVESNGREPPCTFPSGMRTPGADRSHGPCVLDYIFVRGKASVVPGSARVFGDAPVPQAPHLYPSDHFGLAATLSIPG